MMNLFTSNLFGTKRTTEEIKNEAFLRAEVVPAVLNAPPKMVYRSTFTHQVKKIYGKIDVTKPIDWSLLP